MRVGSSGVERSSEGGDLRVRVHRDEARAELLADVDRDDPRVVLGAGVALGEQLLEHHRDLHAVRRRQRVELKRMAADGQLLLVRRARDRAVDVREATAALLVPGPDLGRRVLGRVGHGRELRSSLAANGVYLAVCLGHGKGLFSDHGRPRPHFGVEVNDRSLTRGDGPRLGRTRFDDWLAARGRACVYDDGKRRLHRDRRRAERPVPVGNALVMLVAPHTGYYSVPGVTDVRDIGLIRL